MHNKDDYEGICVNCFAPVILGDGHRFREDGPVFHKRCIIMKGAKYDI